VSFRSTLSVIPTNAADQGTRRHVAVI